MQDPRTVVAERIVEIILRDVLDGLRETDGKNRSPRIDSFNKRVGAPMGSPYCASAAWCAIDDACKELGLKNPVPPTAWSQSFRKTSFVPKKYIRQQGETAKIGDAAIFQVIGNPGSGHYATVSEDQRVQPKFVTLEYNTDGSGSRDGDGAYGMVRSTIGPAGNKVFLCFTDIPQWVVDHNKLLTS